MLGDHKNAQHVLLNPYFGISLVQFESDILKFESAAHSSFDELPVIAVIGGGGSLTADTEQGLLIP